MGGITVAAIATIVLLMAKERFVAPFGLKVQSRFLETGQAVDTEQLRRWITESPREAKAYVCPVLFPFDILFMISFSVFIFLSSSQLSVALFGEQYRHYVAVLPGSYFMVDLVEDCFLASLLLKPSYVGAGSLKLARSVTSLKILLLAGSILQPLVLGTLFVCRGL